MQMTLSIYFHIFTIKFGGYSKKKFVSAGFMGLAFFNLRDPWHMGESGQHQVSRGVVIGIVKGKSMAEPLLNPDTYAYYLIFSTIIW